MLKMDIIYFLSSYVTIRIMFKINVMASVYMFYKR